MEPDVLVTADDLVAEGGLVELPVGLPRFARALITTGARNVLPMEHVLECLRRHNSCDWGDISEDQRAMNDDAAMSDEGRLMSEYLVGGDDIWIITEHDRSVTTVLLPSEY